MVKSNNAYDVASENVKTSGHFNRTIVYLYLVAWLMQKVKEIFLSRIIDCQISGMNFT